MVGWKDEEERKTCRLKLKLQEIIPTFPRKEKEIYSGLRIKLVKKEGKKKGYHLPICCYPPIASVEASNKKAKKLPYSWQRVKGKKGLLPKKVHANFKV